MVSLLLQYGADPNVRGGSTFAGGTALHVAARADASTKLVQLLLQTGADPNARDDTGATPLIEAAKRGAQSPIIALSKSQADARLVDKAGFSAQYYAKKGESRDLM
jgi:ankyrin repeat protein